MEFGIHSEVSSHVINSAVKAPSRMVIKSLVFRIRSNDPSNMRVSQKKIGFHAFENLSVEHNFTDDCIIKLRILQPFEI